MGMTGGFQLGKWGFPSSLDGSNLSWEIPSFEMDDGNGVAL